MPEAQQDSMNEPPIPSRERDGDEINLLDYLEVIARRSGMIIRITAVTFVLSIVVSLLMPKIYSATTRILPPQQDQGMMAAMMGQLGGLAGLAGGMLGGGTTGDLYVGMLNSEAVKDALIDRFRLMDVYEVKYRLDMYKRLDALADIQLAKKGGIISITVEDKDPKRAAALANAFVDELGKLTVRLNVTGAGQNKTFLEGRLAKAKVDLAKAEDSLKDFQTRNKVLDVPEQAKVSIAGVAELRAQLAAQEVQLATLRSTLTDQSQEVKNVKASIANIRGQIARLEGEGRGSSIPSVGTAPSLGQEYLRLMREFKIQETLVELLTKQYEMAKLNEVKDVSGLQVLQKARVPDKKTKPKRALIVLFVTFASFMSSLFLAFIMEYAERMPDGERERWRALRRCLPVRLPLPLWK